MKIYAYLRITYITCFAVMAGIYMYSKQTLDVLSINEYIFYDNNFRSFAPTVIIDTTQNFTINYSLDTSFKVPYAGISFRLNKKQQALMSEFDYCEITIESANDKIIPIILNEEINSHRIDFTHKEYLLYVGTGTKKYRVNYNDFKYAYWWLNQHGLTTQELSVFKNKHITGIDLQNSKIQERQTNDTYTLTSFSLEKRLPLYWLLLPFLCLLAVEISYLIFKKREIKISYDPILLKHKPQINEWDLIQQFIASHYQEQELNLDYIHKHLAISKNRISECTHIHTNLGFKKYINSIRINEAARLLQESDLNISEIAYEVGFSNISHFNRVFKDIKCMSPTSFQMLKSV